jgi:bifunctional non-homologous end joining protein LigD
MSPTPAKIPPTGPDWLHEVKFDGWRMQLHVESGSASLYSKNGTDYTQRFRALKSTLVSIRAKSAVIDCELVACDDAGMPSFRTLMEMGNKASALCLWCFDLLVLDGVRLIPMPLAQRKAILAGLISATDDEHLQFSGDFDDPIKLLETCHKMGLEGVVSKRRELAYGPDERLAEDQDGGLARREP